MIDGEATARLASMGDKSVTVDPSQVSRLYADLAPELRRFVLGVVHDPDLTDDVMQATYLKSIEQGHQARIETARGWLFQVAFREALAARRRLAALDKGNRKLARFQSTLDTAPEARLVQGETVEVVRKALALIPEEQRRVILARIYEDKTFAEIAGEMDLPLGTVLTRMRRGLDKLRKSMTPGG
jgi:RNA polymerase sigma factor (sigma-70 family)